MAKYGANYPFVAKIATEPSTGLPTYDGVGRTIGALNKFTESINFAEGEIYGDDGLAESVKEFVSATGSLTTTDITAADYCYITGAQLDADTNEVIDAGNDEAPPCGFGFVQVIKRNGNSVYRGYYYPKVTFAKPSNEANTKSGSLTLNGYEVSCTVYQLGDCKWRYFKEFTGADGLANARAWVKSKLGTGTVYNINVSKTGTGTVSPLGATVVASAGSFTLTISSGTLTKLYDNGTDVTSSVSSSKYTLSSIAADHDLVAVF